MDETALPSEPIESAESACEGFRTPRDRRLDRRATGWVLATTVSYVVATAAVRWPEHLPQLVPPLLFLLTAGLAVRSVFHYLAYLRAVDELRRRIETEAFALGFAAGLVAAMLAGILPAVGVAALDHNFVVLVMCLTAALSLRSGLRRYGGQGR